MRFSAKSPGANGLRIVIYTIVFLCLHAVTPSIERLKILSIASPDPLFIHHNTVWFSALFYLKYMFFLSISLLNNSEDITRKAPFLTFTTTGMDIRSMSVSSILC